MKPASLLATHRWRKFVTGYPFWVIVASLIAITLLHYFTPQMRWLPLPMNTFLSRHAVERVLFIFPIALSALALGPIEGWAALLLAVLIMLPRALWISPYPVDALVETTSVAVIGYLVIRVIESQDRERKLQQKTISHLRAINTVASIVNGSLEPHRILNDALDKVLQVTKLDAGLVFSLDQQTQELVLLAHRGITSDTAGELTRLKADDGFYGRVAQSGKPVVMPDSSQDPRLANSAVQREELRSQVVAPLESKDKVHGVLAVATRSPRQFLPEELELITAIGNQIGAALENAQLHQDIARQLRIQQQLNQVVERITSELELHRILPKVLQIAEELVGADGGGIALFDQDKKSIHYPYLHNLPQESADLPIPEGNGVAGEVMSTGRPIVVDDYRAYPSATPVFSKEEVASVVAVPIMSGNRSFGALTLVSLGKKRHFSEEEVAILAGIGRQTGIAIENAHLCENLRFYIHKITQAQEGERKRIARDLHDETIQMLIVISRHLEALAALSEQLPETAVSHVGSLRELTSNTLEGIRHFVQDLRPPTLDHLGLVAAMKGLIRDLEKDDIKTDLRTTGEVQRLAPEKELMLFRIVQEALNNVKRHAAASRVEVEAQFHPSGVCISITDNGAGFNAPSKIGDLVSSGRLGLIGMYERARMLDGTLIIRSKPGQGTVVTVDVPAQP